MCCLEFACHGAELIDCLQKVAMVTVVVTIVVELWRNSSAAVETTVVRQSYCSGNNSGEAMVL